MPPPTPPPPADAAPVLRDAAGRPVDYLRVSLTDDCPPHCAHCASGHANLKPRHHLLTDEELLRLLRLFAAEGFHRIHFTGGEPTQRSSLVEIVRETARLPGVASVTLTTNGAQLAELAAPLRAAGLEAVHVALQSFVADPFGRVTRCGDFRELLPGLTAASRAGLRVALHAVVCRALNDGGDALELAALTRRQPWHIRFVSASPPRRGARTVRIQPLAAAQVRARLEASFGALQPVADQPRHCRLADARGTLEFADPEEEPFCGVCNRIRLTSDGELRLCLFRKEELHLRMLLLGGATDDALRAVIRRVVGLQPWGRDLPSDHQPCVHAATRIPG